MSYKIPNKKEILQIIEKVMKETAIVHSLYHFKDLVLKELKIKNKDYRISEKRLRLIAIGSNLINIEIHARETEVKGGIFKCPVCGKKLNLIKNQTVYGGSVTLGHKCTYCPYWTGKKRRIPIRYIFSLK